MTSKYKYVCKELHNGKQMWSTTYRGAPRERHREEKDAAKAVDLMLIKQGKDPVNI